MIKINLLPEKKKKKAMVIIPKITIPSVPTLPMSVVSVITLMVLGFLWFSIENKISVRNAEKKTKEKTLSELKAKVKEVEYYERDNKNFEEKTNIIEQLRKAQSGPVRLLDEISTGIPERVWLSSLNESGGTINIEGLAFSNSDIVLFVNNLKDSKYLTDVFLIESRQTSQEKLSVFQFRMICKVRI